MTRHQYLHLPRSIAFPRAASLLRALALFGLFLLPMQMRAGTDYLHPHALVHLLLDAGDHVLDHHGPAANAAGMKAHGPAVAHGDHSNHPPRVETAAPDLPTFESFQMAAGGLAVALLTAVLLLFSQAFERVWPRRERWHGRRIRPDLPPPRAIVA